MNRDSFKRCSDSQIALKISAYTEKLYNQLQDENNILKKSEKRDMDVDVKSNENIIKLISTFRASGIKESWTENVHLIESNGPFSFDKLERSFSVNILKKIKKSIELYSRLNTPREIERIKKSYNHLKAQIDILTNAKAVQILNILYKEYYSYAHEQYSDIELKDSDFTNSNLYLIAFPQKNILKVERSEKINNRLNDFIPFWGEVDYENSYCLHGSASEVLKLDKALNTFLAHYKNDYTIIEETVSVFKIEALDLAIKHINMYLDSQPEKKSVFLKGLEKREKNFITKDNNKHKEIFKETKKVKTLLDSNKANITKANILNNLSFIFLKNKDKYQYQYDYDKNDIILRIQAANLKERNQLLSIFHKIEKKLTLSYLNDNEYVNISIIQSIKTNNDLIQIVFKQKGYNDFILEHIIPKIFLSLTTAPKKSESLKDELRLLY